VGLSGNGDVLGFAYNTDQEINGIGWGDRKPDLDNPVGPTITSMIDTRQTIADDEWKKGMCIEEGAIPEPFHSDSPRYSPQLPRHTVSTPILVFGMEPRRNCGIFTVLRAERTRVRPGTPRPIW
jgi:hypothetical protein